MSFNWSRAGRAAAKASTMSERMSYARSFRGNPKNPKKAKLSPQALYAKRAAIGRANIGAARAGLAEARKRGGGKRVPGRAYVMRKCRREAQDLLTAINNRHFKSAGEMKQAMNAAFGRHSQFGVAMPHSKFRPQLSAPTYQNYGGGGRRDSNTGFAMDIASSGAYRKRGREEDYSGEKAYMQIY